MTRAFTFGKYYPFHKGHEALINFSLTQCDELIVLVCASDSETISGKKRASWIRKSFPDTKKIKIQVYNYSEDKLPNTSVSSKEVSKVWAEQFTLLLPPMDYVITSEKYGDYIADFIGIIHLPFNPERNVVPISATDIRNDIYTNWNFLSPGAKSFYIKKVVILGTESTGKSTLSESLAKHFNCDLVPEVARSINSQSNECTMEDLETIAIKHAQSILKTSQIAKSPLVIIDTDINITQSYAKFLFQKKLEISTYIKDINQADVYIYLHNDCTHVQDGTRLNKKDRDELHHSHLKTLKENKIDFKSIGGNWENRFAESIRYIEALEEL